MENNVAPNWEAVPPQEYPFPTPSDYTRTNNATYGNCSFNITVSDKEVSMYQDVDVADYTVFIDSGKAEYEISVDMYCAEGCVLVALYFYDGISAELNVSRKSYP